MVNTADLKSAAITIDLMVERGDIVDVEYVLKSAPYRVKSLYFPTDTEVIVQP